MQQEPIDWRYLLYVSGLFFRPGRFRETLIDSPAINLTGAFYVGNQGMIHKYP